MVTVVLHHPPLMLLQVRIMWCLLSDKKPRVSQNNSPKPSIVWIRGSRWDLFGGDSSTPSSRRQQWIYSRVAESLWDNPEFIQAGFHIRHYITAVVDTEAEHSNA
jgi:hypothetical protein